MEPNYRVAAPSPPLVALISWLLPGAGYLVIGQRGRAMGVGISIIVLFILGLLIAGVRVIEVPGYEVATGRRLMFSITDPRSGQSAGKEWVLLAAPLSEIREKPWSVPQILTGPLAITAGAWSVYAASPDPAAPGGQIGAITHARVNEIGSLYLSVAGLLNLMAIIDSTWRASHLNEKRKEPV